MQFIDRCIIELKAGNGGNGVVSWRREAHSPHGGPYGGDGGHGGDVILVGDHNINSLDDLNNQKTVFAQNGENGSTKIAFGKSGENLYIKIPLGTVVYNNLNNKKITEVLETGETFLLCKGGMGGHGNAYFKNPRNKIPNLHENGDIGKSLRCRFVLKYIADVGMVGFPNAGKSTLVGKITSAKPRVAKYQFTTVTPVLGICEHNNKRVIFADIPGLIKGASVGKGLGHEFLRHIERCSILIHIVSLNIDDNEDVVEAYETIMKELEFYKDALIKKPMLVVANKIDLPLADDQLATFKKRFPNLNILALSAAVGTNIEQLKSLVFKAHEAHQEELNKKLDTKKKKLVRYFEVYKKQDFDHDLNIVKLSDHMYEATSQYLKYWTHKIPLSTTDNIIRYNQKMKNVNVEEKVKQLGGEKGDTLIVYGNELTVD